MMVVWLWWGSGMAVALVGAALLVWALFSDRSRGRKRCPKCWYSLERAPSWCCPECGNTVQREGQLFNTRRRWGWVGASIVLLVAAAYLAAQPKVQQDGWRSLVPSVVLVLALNLESNEWVIEEFNRRYKIVFSWHVHDWQHVDEHPSAPVRVLLGRTARRLAMDDQQPAQTRVQYIEWASFASAMTTNSQHRRRTADVFIQLLDDPEYRVRFAAVLHLPHALSTDDAVAQLVDLRHRQAIDQQVVLLSLGLLMDRSDHALREIVTALNDERDSIRREALKLLHRHGERGCGSKELIDAVEPMLDDSSEGVRRMAAQARIALEPPERRAAVAASLFASDDDFVRFGAWAQVARTYRHDIEMPGAADLVLKAAHDDHRFIQQVAWQIVWLIPTDDLRDRKEAIVSLTERSDQRWQAVADTLLTIINASDENDAP